MEDLQRAFIARDVQLVARCAVEGVPLIRPDLRRDAEAAEQAERAAGDRGFGDVQVDGDFAAPLQMDAPG